MATRAAFVFALIVTAFAVAGCFGSNSSSSSSAPTTHPATTTTSPTSSNPLPTLPLPTTTTSASPSPTPAPNGTAPKTYNVTIAGFKFVNNTNTLNIHVGDTIHWVHHDGQTPHTVTSDASAPESFDSSPNCVAGVPSAAVCMVEGSVFDHTFSHKGTYSYHCKVHSSMTATIIVS